MYLVPDTLASPYTYAFTNYKLYAAVAQHAPIKFVTFAKGEGPNGTAFQSGTTVGFCEPFLASLDYVEAAGVICHEIAHYMHNHDALHWRWRADGFVDGHLKDGSAVRRPYTNKITQVAFDMIVNDSLIQSGVKLPQNHIHFPHLATWRDTEGDAYVRIWQQMEQNGVAPEQGRGQGRGQGQGQGQGQGDPTDNSMSGDAAPDNGQAPLNGGSDVQPVNPASSPHSARRTAILRKVLTELSTRKLRGWAPSDLEKLIDVVAPMRVDWKEQLRPRYQSNLGGGHETWTRFNRTMFAQRIILPGRVMKRAGFVVLVIDTSGSINRKEQRAFITGNVDMFKETMPRRLIVLEVDAMVQRETEITSLSDLERFIEPLRTGKEGHRGGGGTSMVAGHRWIEEKGWRPDMTVYFTDMGTDFPDDLGNSREVLWCATRDGEAPLSAGRTIRVEVE